MTKPTIEPDEIEIHGQWIRSGDRVEGDAATKRIKELVKTTLREVGRDASGWDVLYLDPHDGRFWELIYPHSEMHGGGPPLLRHLTEVDARAKYGNDVPAVPSTVR